MGLRDLAWYLPVGLVLGLLTLPWHRQIGNDRLAWHWLGFVFYWPFLLFVLAVGGVIQYLGAWRTFSRERRRRVL